MRETLTDIIDDLLYDLQDKPYSLREISSAIADALIEKDLIKDKKVYRPKYFNAGLGTYEYRCSVCASTVSYDDRYPSYCPHCGVKLK